MANLLESYKTRLAVSESYYAKSHNGEKLPQQKKLVVAKLLENQNKFLSEAFEQSVGTQRSDMGHFRKFSMNLTTVATPNLIAFDLVLVQPMSSLSGYVNYIKYTVGSNKGDSKRGEVLNSPFGLGKVDPYYTTDKVVETIGAGVTEFKAAWTPVLKGFFRHDDAKYDVKIMKADGSEQYANFNDDGVVTVAEGDRVAYVYDNVSIPQNDLPVVNAEMDTIPLVARARRIAIYYSQMAAFQAKTDYGFDLGDQLAEKAVAQLSYEIDTEVCQLLIDNADADDAVVFNKTVPYGISMMEHYAAFAAVVEKAKQKVYDRTKRFMPNYMLVASDLMPVLTFVPGFKAASASNVNGPYMAGTFNGMKVFVTPNIEAGKFVLGVNGNDMMSSAAVYAPYMPVVPTQLLSYADGGMSQGWSTMYDLKILNKNLLVAGKIVEEAYVVNTKEQA